MQLGRILQPGSYGDPTTVDDLSLSLSQVFGAVGLSLPDAKASHYRQSLIDSRQDEVIFETNLQAGHIDWSLGMEKYLGHPDVTAQPLPPDYLSEHIPPTLRNWYRVFRNAALLVMIQRAQEEGRGALHFDDLHFTTHFSLQKANGEIVQVKETIMPFYFDDRSRITRFLHRIILFGYPQETPLQPQLYYQDQPSPELYAALIRKVAGVCKLRRNESNLTAQQFQLSDAIENLFIQQLPLNPTEIARYLGNTRSPETIRRNLDRIKHQLLILTGDPFSPSNALQVIRYLQQSGFIDVLKVLKEG